MDKIAVVLTDYFEDREYKDPVLFLQNKGYEVDVISDEADRTLVGKQGQEKVSSDLSIEDAKEESYAGLLIPGGFSPDILRADERFVEFGKQFMFKDKPVMAICHGPQLLITAEVLSGRKVTGYQSILVDLKNADANVFDKEVVVCGNLVTSRTPDDIPAFNETSLKVLSKAG